MDEILVFGDAADLVIQHLAPYRELSKNISGNPELYKSDPDEVSAEMRALAVTFSQVLAYGDEGRHKVTAPDKYANKLERNLYLARINRDIHGLVLEDTPHWLIIEGRRQTIKIDLGHLSGITVTYPLNPIGEFLYRRNELGPHRFLESHLVHEQSFSLASAVFIGGAIDLYSVQNTLSTPKRDFVKDHEPKLLVHAIARNTLKFLPKVLGVKSGCFGPTFNVDPEGPLPVVFTSFSGRGTGEDLARLVGFVRENRIEAELGDRRYYLDLNSLNEDSTKDELKCKLFKAWSWFERTSAPIDSKPLCDEIDAAIKLNLGVRDE